VQDELVRLAIEGEGARLMHYLLASLHACGLSPQHETSLALLVKRETARRYDNAALDLVGPYAPLRTGSPHAQIDSDVKVESPAEREVSMANAKCIEAIPVLTRTAHQIYGVIAYHLDYPLELHYHHLIGDRAAYGYAGHHRRAFACLLR
jgi:alkylation response protein AidB-like acyl-CoA dehydrogenase